MRERKETAFTYQTTGGNMALSDKLALIEVRQVPAKSPTRYQARPGSLVALSDALSHTC